MATTTNSADNQEKNAPSKTPTSNENATSATPKAGNHNKFRTANVTPTDHGRSPQKLSQNNKKTGSEAAKKNWGKVELKEVAQLNPHHNKNGKNAPGLRKDSASRSRSPRERSNSLMVPGDRDGQLGENDIQNETDHLSLGSRRESLDSKHSATLLDRLQRATVVHPPGSEEKPKSVLTNNDTYIKSAIPCLPLGLALLFCFLNIILPGIGTMLSGFAILCCGEPRINAKDDRKSATLCCNVFVGAAQMMTITFLLVGWFWSVSWGISMVALAVAKRKEEKEEKMLELKARTLVAFGSPVRTGGLMKYA
ncbi:uncharacterized protein LOC106150685 [Lingula anatina]|uniref:Uncharacterized protein LOC106150685 n=1 Tax=Lingula anatina TaxID=7574 RepID=A0A1S3GYX8_LINAN|nr:uncharacterized protein LOC106150685 [Lingula anatina]|eukprot:XP_013379075.1 uncharacterized protein LOC106150685 [Lingula anatina]